jgi:ketosteroid isomerase-like protein
MTAIPGSGASSERRGLSIAEALAAEDARYAAQIGADFEAMARLFADDLVYVHSSGAVDGKATYIERMRSGALIYRGMEKSNVEARVFGPVAILTGIGHFDVTVDGKETVVRVLFHSVWVKTDSSVRFVSWQSTPVPVKT